MIKLILACDLNGVIGKDNDMPWKRDLPYDLKRFRELTKGHIIVYGRRTFESLGSKPLPNRENVVLTSRDYKDFPNNNLYFSRFVDNIIDEYEYTGGDKDLWICGGMQVYKQFMPYVQEVYITIVRSTFEGDTMLDDDFRTVLEEDFKWEVLGSKSADEENKYAMDFIKYTRVKGEY